MSLSDGIFHNLRQKLDVLGYTQSLPLAAIPLVAALFEDLVKTTESLRDAKKKLVDLLEEKSCWELGIEPYKCDNSRLLAECNQLHLQALKEREDFEQRASELASKIRKLQTDKLHLEQHGTQLQQQLRTLLEKQTSVSSNKMKNYTESKNKTKKPFITVVRSGELLPSVMPLSENAINIRCSKCNAGYYHQPGEAGLKAATLPINTFQKELDKLENNVKDLTEEVSFYKRKVEARDREIRRLNDMLTGGRPPAALAKDCCYKDVRILSEDIDLMQREKNESLNKIREYQDQMHEAMQRALDLESQNRKLQKELEELKSTALQVETQANAEIEKREHELDNLRMDLKQLQSRKGKLDLPNRVTAAAAGQGKNNDNIAMAIDKRSINERLNALTQRETELNNDKEHLQKKIQKLKTKINSLQKDLRESIQQKDEKLDEDKIRLKSERDFFQKEYLRLISKATSEKEVDFLQSQVKAKDEELRILRSELCLRQTNAAFSLPQPLQSQLVPTTARTENSLGSSSSSNSDCVQAVVLRVERERDCVQSELERIRNERDSLRERHICLTQRQIEEAKRAEQRMDELKEQVQKLEREKRELNSSRLPSETQIVLLKEEIDGLKNHTYKLQEENCKLKTSYNQLKILHEQTERSLMNHQNKLVVTEHQLETASSRLNIVDTNRETTHNETIKLRSEVAALKQTYVTLEHEKDTILANLDAKTEYADKLESELKTCKEKRSKLEKRLNELEEQYEKLNIKTRERDSELYETSTESKSLRQQILSLKISRDEAIAENGRLTNELAENQAEILTLKKKLKDSEMEIGRLKQQLHQYVQEVKKAEDLLTHKEQEREEMLEHYRSLSQDAVLLEGNNQSLENEAAEYKRLICELETEIEALKKEICCRNSIIEQLEDKISALSTQNTCLETQLEEAIDEQRLLKIDLAARKELCDKLDIQKDKLNAELTELNEIRRKLERDNEKLRNENEKASSGTKVSSDTLEELLSKTRRDLEEQIKTDSKLSQELVRLRQKNEQLLNELDAERQKRQQHETLAHEYQVQNQELRHNLTDDRFRQARSREQSPRFPTQTM